MVYKKHFIALESNPDLFTRLIHELGVSEDLAFHDVLSLAEPDLLGMIPRPVLALVIVFPTPSDYEDRLARENESTPAAWSNGNDADVVWFKQTINNACGLYGILHAITNGPARQYIRPESWFARLLAKSTNLPSTEIASLLEGDSELESAYTSVALLGDTEPPENPEDEVDFHYVCFVKSHKNDNLYMMDGDRNGPSGRGSLPEGDLLSPRGIETIQQFIEHHGENGHFSLLALAAE